jgi:hypothetical protein
MKSMANPLEYHGIKQVIPRSALMIILQASSALDVEPEIVIFPSLEGVLGPWVCFNLDGRKFGIWTATMALYEGDEHGAMGTDILNPASLVKK